MSKSTLRNLLLLLAVALLPSRAVAATFNVNTTSDNYEWDDGLCSLREAAIAANFVWCVEDCGCSTGSDVIQLQGGQTYALNEALEVYRTMTIQATPSSRATLSPAAGVNDDGMVVLGGALLTLADVNLKNFRRRALVAEWGGEFLFSRGDVSGCSTPSPESNRSSSINVAAGGRGTVDQANIYSNTASRGAGILIDETGRLLLRNSVIGFNQASQYGGGVLALGELNCQGSFIHSNSAGLDGGGVYRLGSAPMNLGNCAVFNNTTQFGKFPNIKW